MKNLISLIVIIFIATSLATPAYATSETGQAYTTEKIVAVTIH